MEQIAKLHKPISGTMICVAFFIVTLFSSNLFAQDKDIIITVKALGPDQYSDIQYQSIEVSQIVDFSNLIRVFINKSSNVLIDKGPAAFDSTSDAIKKVLITHIENKYGELTPETIVNAKCDLKLLVRKSVYTNRDDYKAFMKMIDNAIWSLQSYYSISIYGIDFPSLTTTQKDNINKLIPLKNFLAKDNTD